MPLDLEALSPEQRARVEEAYAKRTEIVQNNITEALINAEVQKATAPSTIKQEMLERDLTLLDTKIGMIEELDVEVRTSYDGGAIIAKLITITRSVLFTNPDDKATLLLDLGVSEALLENISDSVGNPAYYQPTLDEIRDEVYPNTELLKESLEFFAFKLGLSTALKFDKFSDEYISERYKLAKKKAQALQINTRKANDEEVKYEM